MAFVRKWSDEQRTEGEVVTRWKMDEEQVEAFVCVANGLWRTDQKSNQSIRITDTLVANGTLLDRAEDGDTFIFYRKSIDFGGPLDVITSQIWVNKPQYDWPLGKR